MLPAQLPTTNINSICTVDFERRHLDICSAIGRHIRTSVITGDVLVSLSHASDYVVKVFALDGSIIQLCLFYIGHDIGEYIGCFIWDKNRTTTEIGPEQSTTTECALWCFSKSK